VLGVLTFALGNLAFRVAVAWDANLGGALVYWSFENGAMILHHLNSARPFSWDSTRVVGTVDVLERLEELAQLVIGTALNKLAGR